MVFNRKSAQQGLCFMAITTLLWTSASYIKEAGEPDLNPSPQHLFTGTHGAVSSDVDICSEMAVRLMRDKGASAVDAAVTTTLCIGSINSFSSGIGGGGFMTVRDHRDRAIAFNFREMAPGAATKNMFIHDPMLSQVGGLAVAIPGEVAGLEAAHKKFGRLSWYECFEPVIELNRYGFVVQPTLAMALERYEQAALENPIEWACYLRDDGRLVRAGEVIKRQNLADTLELIATHGSSVFYDPDGPIAPHLAATTQSHGGILTAEDFAHYSVEETEPLVGQFMGRKIYTTPNPTSGPALLLGLNILEGWENNDHEFGDLESHQLMEAMKFMASGRSELGDLNANQSHLDHIASKDYARELRAKIGPETHPWQYYDPAYEPNQPNGTAHLSVVDADGMAVSLTTTVNLGFGAQIIDPTTGIVLNSEMDDFSTPNASNYFGLSPSIYNYIKPYHRPLSSTVPTIVVRDNKPEIVIGASGGSHITTAVLQAIIRLVRYNTPLLDAIAFPRLHHQLLPNEVMAETNTPKRVLDTLSARKHKVVSKVPSTSMNGIHLPPGGDSGDQQIHAVSDWWRKRGEASAY